MNSLHGSAYYDYNGSASNARSFFAKTCTFRGEHQLLRQHRRPYTAQQDIFFFADYEGSRKHNVAVLASNAPLSDWRNGDFSGLLASGGKTIKNPFTGQPFQATSFPAA